jgi:tellurite resistance protein
MTDTRRVHRIPLSTLAIAFGLVGLADVWTAATTALDLPIGIAEGLWIVAALSWLWLLIAHTRRGRRADESLPSQLRHPLQGPIAALAPIVGMLLGGELFTTFPLAGRFVVVVFIAVTAVFAGWLIGVWFGGTLELGSLHGGYFLPTVAGGFIAATAAAEVHLPTVAMAAFAVGTFFWVAMFTLIAARLMFRPALPASLVPTLAILVAPPAVAGTAWFLIDPTPGPIAYALSGVTVVMLLIQLALVPRYRKLPFSLGFWSFTFPFAAVGGSAIGWLDVLRPAGWQILTIAVLAGVTALIATIAIKSLQLLSRTIRPPMSAAPLVDIAVASAPVLTERLKVS